MALDVEGVVGCGMHREKSLRGSHALEPLHLPFPSSGRLMRILRSIVAPSTAFMAVRDSEMTGCSPVRAQVNVGEFYKAPRIKGIPAGDSHPAISGAYNKSAAPVA
jgi:hypothetical protein